MWNVIFRTVKVSAVGQCSAVELCSTVRQCSPVEEPASGREVGLKENNTEVEKNLKNHFKKVN